MSDDLTPEQAREHHLARIRDFVIAHRIPGERIALIFTAGLAAAHALRPDICGEDSTPAAATAEQKTAAEDGADAPLKFAIDASEIEASMRGAEAKLLELEPGLRKLVLERLLSSLDHLRLDVRPTGDLAASTAGDVIVGLRVVGLDEIIAAALGAADLGSSHSRSPVGDCGR